MRNHPVGRLALALVATVTVGAGLSGPAQVTGAAYASPAYSYDGRAVLEGTFFGWGPFAQEHPQLILPERPLAETPYHRTIVTEGMATMEVRAPGQLARYQSGLYSGNPQLIRSITLETLAQFDLAVTTNNTGGSKNPPNVTAGVSGKAESPSFDDWVHLVAILLSPGS
jgi:hypothetical protein